MFRRISVLSAITSVPRTDLDTKANALSDSRIALAKYFEGLDKENIDRLSEVAQNAQAELFKDDCRLLCQQIKANAAQIREYEAQREQLQKGSGSEPLAIAAALQNVYADKAGIPHVAPVPLPGAETGGKDDSDFWTSVSLEVSSSSREESETQSTSWSLGGSPSWGHCQGPGAIPFRLDSQSNASKQMANSSVKISFECMRVDITRPWLRGELFYDHDLRVACDE